MDIAIDVSFIIPQYVATGWFFKNCWEREVDMGELTTAEELSAGKRKDFWNKGSKSLTLWFTQWVS